MKESISYTYLLNMMLVFIVISFCVIACVFSYSKAFRVNSKIINALEEAEGYNDLAKNEINRITTSLGYRRSNVNCQKKDGVEPIKGTVGYCLYEYHETINDEPYIRYGVKTYMEFDFPVLNSFLRIPVYNTTEKIYLFGMEVINNEGSHW